MNNDFELENMRQQMQTLKNKLNKQEIVNDRLMRRSMTKEVTPRDPGRPWRGTSASGHKPR